MKRICLFVFIAFSGFSYSDSLSVLFLGDTYFGESYQNNPEFNRGVNIIKERGYDSFFENVKDLLFSSGFAIANLETALLDGNHMPTSSIGNYIHFADTRNTPFFLAKYNIKALNLANNHTMDLGFPGLASTINALGKNGISSFGAGQNEYDASKPLIMEFSSRGKTNRLYVIGSYWKRDYFVQKGHYASGILPGVNMLDTNIIRKQISDIRSKDANAFIVLYPHWGRNYKPVNQFQRSAAHSIINSGVDLIIGHAAHTVQEAEFYKGRWIFYNIGNFIFNAPGRYRSANAKPYGMIVNLLMNGDNVLIKLYPVFTDNKKSNYKLRFLDENELEDCLSVIESESAKGKLIINKNGFIEVH